MALAMRPIIRCLRILSLDFYLAVDEVVLGITNGIGV
jgi:hypothetical protein